MSILISKRQNIIRIKDYTPVLATAVRFEVVAEQIVRLCRTGAGRMGSRGPASPGLQSQTFAGAVPREEVTN